MLRQGERVELTGTEFELLALLAAEPGKVFSRDDILNRLRGHEAELYTRAVDIVVSRLRKKLEPLDCIKTLRNAGYALAVARERAPREARPRTAAARAAGATALRHSLRVRLVVRVPAAGAGDGGASSWAACSSPSPAGWREAARPLLADYVDRLVAEIGTPPDVARAQALAQRLPITHPHRRARRQLGFAPRPAAPAPGGIERARSAIAGSCRTTADGHRISLRLGAAPWQRAPQASAGSRWRCCCCSIAAGLCLLCAACCGRSTTSAPARERFGRGDFAQPIPLRRRDELGDLAQRINTMAHDIQDMLDAKRALLLALSHELRSPLTRARLNAELLPDTPEGAAERDALLRDLGEMRDLISDLLESERLASPHAALQREPIDLAALVREVAAECPNGDRCTLDLAADLPPLPLDRTRMRLLLRNLLDNALRHGAGAPQPPQRLAARAARRRACGSKCATSAPASTRRSSST